MSGGPLAGIRVVDLTTIVVGPTATLFLADYGAEVIKVEAPGGDLLRTLGGRSKSGQLSGKFTHFNRNKRSPCSTSSRRRRAGAAPSAGNRRRLHRQHPAHGAGALGLGTAALRERHSRLIVCNLMGFGRGGRYAERPAYDLIIQGLSGVAVQRTHLWRAEVRTDGDDGSHGRPDRHAMHPGRAISPREDR